MDKKVTPVRMADSFYEEIKALANETGASVNSMMLHLMGLGLRIYKDGATIHLKQS